MKSRGAERTALAREMLDAIDATTHHHGAAAWLTSVPHSDEVSRRSPRCRRPCSSDRSLDVDTDLLRPNPFQPRTAIDETKSRGARSLHPANGIIQPIVVRRAGECRSSPANGDGGHAQRAGLLEGPGRPADIPDDRLAAALIEPSASKI